MHGEETERILRQLYFGFKNFTIQASSFKDSNLVWLRLQALTSATRKSSYICVDILFDGA